MRVSILWIFGANGWVIAFMINLLLPGVIQDLMIGQTGNSVIAEERNILYALFYIIPFTVALLTLTPKDLWNRRLNISLRIIFSIILFLSLLIHAVNFINGIQESIAIWLIMITNFLITYLITLLAWKYYPNMDGVN